MSMANRDGVIWYDGKMVPWRDANVHVLTHTLHYGVGVFEGLRAYQTAQGPAIFRLQEHTDRLFNSAHIFMMKIPFDKATLIQAQCDVVKQNNLESGYIRPIVFYGSEAMGLSAKTLSVHVAIAAWPWGTYLGTNSLEEGIRVKTASFSRHHVNTNMCRAKSVSTYANSILAHQEVANNGYDEALLLDVDGYVAEGSGENIFIIKQNKLYTPDLTSCLEGITRASVIELAAEIGIPLIEKRITRDEIYCADEAFFTGTAAEITPIRELDNRTIGSGKRGPITARLQTMFFDCVKGKAQNHMDWLSFV
ncbi:branched chain amino acid aminotransferase apoenzyme [Nitrosomonas cryotolerans]|uniref:Branched-chain-amino-acid aminotransferase n=1 Tax=Nitrosomonas cryotolerans ATCC 49181 TaxID=1131553 RepID=A0A1N6JEA0_9PROT|nr:branched-chain amino acid transaminase [Nitrosomonas cryotolerans]SFP49850.1 branched chain amino acid aminotransferase apoenzyme [Nitrosomonas cryotolerans]SIO42543.1 branched chain amino acid aminotransferase apoenzyme [Nitrosomonas cryotolerans ATCC 49181]